VGVFGRRTAGQGIGALHGDGPDHGIGLPFSVGFSFHDDFLPTYNKNGAGEIGEQHWDHTHVGANGSFSSVTPSADTEAGLLRVVTANQANSATIVHQGTIGAFFRCPAPGAIWACKLRLGINTPTYEVWSGFANLTSARVRVTDTTQFIGVRALNGNVFGVVKDGSGAANESTVDLGSDYVGVYRTFGFRVEGTTASPSIQFFEINQLASDRAIYDRVDIGAPITTNLPNTTLCLIGMGLTGVSQVGQAEGFLDWWSIGGRVAR